MSLNSTNENSSVPELFLHKLKSILLLAIFSISSFSAFSQETVMVNFSVDMNALEVPNADYDNVVINGSWNGWSGWGVVLADDDGDNVWTGSADIDPAVVQFEYVVAVTGPADGWSGWGQQFGNGCEGTNFLVIFEEGVTTYDQFPTVGCEGVVLGCTDEAAENYNADATDDDGSCTYPLAATTFNVDMSCADVAFTNVYITGPFTGWCGDCFQLTDPDGDGIYSGTFDFAGDVEYKYEVDNWAFQEDLIDDAVAGATCAPVTDYANYANRLVAAGSTTNDTYGSCDDCADDAILGCMDASACNYNMDATEDDGSCTFATEGFDCDGNCLTGTAVVYTAGSYASENSFTISDCDGVVLASMASGVDGFNSCVEFGENYIVSLVDSYGDGWNGGSLSIGGVTYTIDAGTSFDEIVGSCGVAGCMDATACNYNMDATFDDGSCTYAEEGLDCDGACLDGGAVLVMEDSYGDGWNGAALTINGVDYTVTGSSATVCVPTADCYVMSWTAGAWDSETSWSFEGTSGSFGSTPSNIGDCVTGCTDASATNYNADADISDNTLCEYALVQGCMDATACNFDAAAEQDNGSCEYPAEGFDCEGNCISGTAVVYTSGSYASENSFTISDCDGVVLASMASGVDGFNSCIELGENYTISLVDSWGDGWNGGSLSIGGVTYTIDAGTSFDEIVGSCGVAGCTDPAACNYNMDATFDDGTCDVPAEGFDCEGNCISGTAVVYTSGSYASENSFTISDCDGVVLAEMTSGTLGFNSCVELGENYSISLVDSYGDSWNGGSLSIGGVDYTVGFDDNGGSSFSTLVGSCGVAGCTDETAFNYNPDATFDDGSCVPVIEGCTNPFSNNYADNANTDDGTCTFCVGGEEVTELAEGVYPDASIVVTVNTGAWANEIQWSIETPGGDVVMSGSGYSNYTEYVTSSTTCLTDGCYKFIAIDTYGDGWNDDGSFTITTQYEEVLIPTTYVTGAMGFENENFDQEVAFYFTLGDASCAVYGCTDPAAANYNVEATDEDDSCIYCEEGSDEFIFSFNQENDVTDEVYVFSETDTVFSVVDGDLGFYDTGSELNCVPEGCYTIAMFEGDNQNDGWDDGSTLIITDGLMNNNLVFGFETGSVAYETWAVGNVVCENNWVPGCMDETALNFDAAATYDDGSCSYLGDDCETALTGVPSNVTITNGDGSWIEVCADPNGFGAVILFDEVSETEVNYQAVNVNMDSCTGEALYGFVDYEFNLIGEIALEAGQCLYFSATDPYGYVNYEFFGYGSSSVIAIVQENPDTNLVAGCTDPTACNFDPAAEAEDYSCEYPAEGFDCEGACLDGGSVLVMMDSYGDGWNGNAIVINGESYTFNTGDESSVCVPAADCYILEWTLGSYLNETSFNFMGQNYSGGSENIPSNLGTCTVGCTDEAAANYDGSVDISDNTLCEYDVPQGCTDVAACNYDSEAINDDGSCEYPAEGLDCNGDCLTGGNYVTFGGGSWIAETSYLISDCNGDTLLFGGGVADTICVDLGDNFLIDMQDSYGDGWNGNVLTISGVEYTVSSTDNNGDFNFVSVGECPVGCTDATALNYDEAATIDDGSCTYLGDDCETALVDVPSEVFTTGDDGNWVVVCADPDGFGAVISFEETSATGVYYQQAIVALDSCNAVPSVGFVNSTSPEGNTIGEFELEAGQCLYFQANDVYGYVDYAFYEFGSSAVSAIVQENPDTALIAGCTDETACNFNPDAQAEDYSCEYPEEGFDCEGACLNGGEILAIFDSWGDGWNGNILTINGEEFTMGSSDGFGSSGDSAYFCVTPADCYIFGWTSGSYVGETSWTFNGVSGEAGSIPDALGDCGVLGCTDPLAPNYNVDATEDDGSCEFYCTSGSVVTFGGGSYISEATYSITDCDGVELFAGGGVAEETCFDLPENYIIYMNDSWGDGWNGNILTIDGVEYTLASGSSDFSIVGDCGVLGCTDATAFNYNADATIDDGSCIAVVYGCTDEAAENFNADANTDDESCTYCDAGDQFTLNMYDSWGDGWNGGTFTATTADGYSVSAELTSGAEASELVCLPVGCYEVVVGGGSYDNEIDFSIDGLLEISGAGTYTEVSVGGGCHQVGCTDPAAANYLENADEDDGSCMYSTIFNVDMCGAEDFTNVYITGPWCGWCGAEDYNLLTDEDGDGIYTIDLWFAAGETIEYKYMTDNWADQENLIDDMIAGATCAPVTDYNSYANRQTTTSSVNDDVYGHCISCETVYGCTDEAAINYNADATVDDGSCLSCELATVNFSVNAGDVVSADYDNVVINGSFAGPWYGWGVVLSDEDGDGVYTGSTQVEAGVTHEYVHALTGAADGWSGWGVIGYAPESCAINDSTPNYYFTAECGETIDLPTVCFGSCTDCEEFVEVLGCTDPVADNYDPNANTDDESCTYCGDFEAVLISSSDATAAGSCDGSIQATGQGGSSNYSLVVYDANGVPQNPFGLCAGTYTAVVTDNGSACTDELTVTIAEPVVAENPCDITPTGMYVDNIIHNRVVFNWSAPSAAPSHYMIRYRAVGTSSWTVMTAGPVNSNEFTGTSRTRYFMEAGTTYQWSMRARVLNEDGSMNCQSPWSSNSEYTTLPECANLENLSVSTEANWVTLMADAPSAEWGVWQSKGKMREVGTNSYRYVNGDSEGAINFLKGNFDASTEYEWHTKAWCTGNVDANGAADPMYHSGWGDFSTFTTEAPCDAVPTNLTTTANGANTAITMNWDTPESGAPDHYFLELTDETTGQVWAWNAIAGNSNSKTKFGLTTGNDFSWRIRGACGTNGTSWATSFTSPVYYTLGGERLAGPVANLDVYPNPSRDIFNVSFESAEAQTMTVRVVNMIGEEVYTEELTEFVGSYNKVIDMNTQPKGVYFLEITTTNGGINKKIVLQ